MVALPCASHLIPHLQCPILHYPRLKHHQSFIHNFIFDLDPSAHPSHSSTNSVPIPPATQLVPDILQDYHEKLTGQIYDSSGNVIDAHLPTPSSPKQSLDDWGSYGDHLWFEAAEFIFK
ncbi:hypothetical protein J3R82DRAFT_11349 [Butyriboletus roseoflavus]|nr:hypothetical protein J3R82DRAFT_11349 [Butyriboletus roseoflavus]